MKRELEDQLGGRRHAEFSSRESGQHLEVLLERLEYFVRIQLEIAHDLGEGVPFDLRELEEDELVG